MGQKKSRPKGEHLHELRRKVPNMDIDDIKQAYEDFLHQSGGKDRLTKGDFINVYKQAFGNHDATELAENIFESFDTDKSGFVDFEEFLVGLSITEGDYSDKECLERKLKWAFSVYDRDKDGTINRNEIRNIVQAVGNIIPDKEFLKGKSARQYADQLFDSVDADQNGQITFDEFQRAAEKDPTLVELLQPAPNEDIVYIK